MTWFFKKKYEKIGVGVYIKDGKLFFTHEINGTHIYHGVIVYYTLDREIKDILRFGIYLKKYDPLTKLAEKLMDWNLDENYERLIIKRFKELKVDVKEEKRKKDDEYIEAERKLKEKLKFVRNLE